MSLVGPLGWPYPFLNLFLKMVSELKERKRTPRLIQRQQSSDPLISNLETVTWTDWKGRERKMSIHREVR